MRFFLDTGFIFFAMLMLIGRGASFFGKLDSDFM